MTRPSAVPPRSARAWAVGLPALLVAAWSAPQAPRLAARLSDEAFPVAIVALAHLALLVVAAWSAVVVLLDSLGGLPRRAARLLTPHWAQGVLLASVGTLATVVPAHADPGSLDGLRLPERPVVSSSSEPRSEPVRASRVPDHDPDARRVRTVTVRTGDTLWAIAADGLEPGADPSAVKRSVDLWHRSNLDVIGPDPDVLHPGQVLAAPDGTAS
ncbi:MAG: LysM peptidoglycan-binding domain-containing protein [Actinomycetales bacterium]|nr:MAG: LysM peptidoglycan-binding domain-containing protein [Actinomycetales bacterium]